ncbi:hypothetical protein [Enterococcus phage TJE2]|jgi:hypothetical protein|uniref:Uncharacterized protein n=4 Tax=Schiekvirus TaxID=2732968 RepID=A0AAE9GD16_9CAUD|nr:hypothetical protein HOU42_gp012 [Enterococcus phage EfV12-phi1]UKM17560.1 hypothetical protein [Enterococcus phage UTI-EfS3]UNZ10665.1 hypothetical protein DIEEDFHO_00004 [Enterococcus phage vB_OCPT_Bill]UPW35247.1 hypothetical protein KEBGJNKE_00008 [Enterococcus phage vB_OCPT_Bop]UVD43274.1 hypothetical protein [Enterococcus phage TJE2]AYJ73375.1 hypothetical protein EFV12PHI1_130 [Enterococcus phage EfV12-phi1]
MNKFLEERKSDLLIQQKEQAQTLLHYIEENKEPDQTIIQRQTNRLNRLSAQIYEIKMIQRKLKRI